MVSRRIYNSIWLLSMKTEQRRFAAALNHVRKAQEQILFKIVVKNKDTEYGRKYGFSKIKSVADYQKAVPLSIYDDYLPYIERISEGRQAVLTAEKVLLFEPSSGTVAATKYIPYTAELKKEFQRGIYPWLADTYAGIPTLISGSSYWSVTPPEGATKALGKVSVGFEADSSYLGAAVQILLEKVFPVPPEIKKVDNMDAFRYITLLFLLKTSDLALLSVWNPTFLMLLLEPLPKWQDTLLTDLATGKIHPPDRVPANLLAKLEKRLGQHPQRAKELRTLFKKFSGSYSLLWPKLKLVSCWTDANAAAYVSAMQQLFPLARIQGKGLLATEGLITIPYSLAGGNVLAVRSHFYEFIDQDNGQIKMSWELEKDKCYSVVLTTSGGLYRYRLLDLVKVTGFYKECPFFAFIGKEEKVADYFGEKLHERFVLAAITKLFVKYELSPKFYMVAPEEKDGRTCYVLFAQPRDFAETSRWVRLVRELDAKLQENFHFSYCRKLGQLGATQLFLIQHKGAEIYMAECKRQGQKLGNIKPTALHTRKGWASKFIGEYVLRRTI